MLLIEICNYLRELALRSIACNDIDCNLYFGAGASDVSLAGTMQRAHKSSVLCSTSPAGVWHGYCSLQSRKQGPQYSTSKRGIAWTINYRLSIILHTYPSRYTKLCRAIAQADSPRLFSAEKFGCFKWDSWTAKWHWSRFFSHFFRFRC
jgi:hypothetical protein